jgi:hypothetical protein
MRLPGSWQGGFETLRRLSPIMVASPLRKNFDFEIGHDVGNPGTVAVRKS